MDKRAEISPGTVLAKDTDALCVYVGIIDGVPHGKVVEGEREWAPLPLDSILARTGWEEVSQNNSLRSWFDA